MAESVLDRLNRLLDGRYGVERTVGEGGMATVYLAHDMRHERRVALKVLKPSLAGVVGPERFLAEIKTTANLQHPHILPLHDSGEAGDCVFYVMPFVEGETLRERLEREGQLPVEEAVRITTGVAQALAHAHDRGVIHRDIKPANILLQDGEPLVADFGIALALDAVRDARLTETGLSLGTPHYMSPEQAIGEREVGPASDIWSLGCVLYEMLTGEPPYTGRTGQAILGRIVTREPDAPRALRKSVAPHVDAAVRRALEKIPADRFPDAGAFASALRDAGFRHGLERMGAADTRVPPRRAGAVVLVAALLGWLAWTAQRPEAAGPPLTVVELSTMADDHPPLYPFALGRAGTGFAYMGPVGPRYRDWDELSSEILPLQGPGGFALSPDASVLAFAIGGGLTLLDLSSRVTRRVPEGTTSDTPWIGRDGYVYFTGRDSTIKRFPTDGVGEVESLDLGLKADEVLHQSFQMLPGDETAILEILTPEGDYRIKGVDLATRERVPLVSGSAPQVSPTGHLVFGSEDGRLTVARLDERSLEIGPLVPIADRVVQDQRGRALASLAPDGTALGYWTGPPGVTEDLELVWVSRSGVATPVDPGWTFDMRGPDANLSVSLSPNGSRIALPLSGVGVRRDIWVKDLDDGSLRRVTFWNGDERTPVWASDSLITFLATPNRDPYDFAVWRHGVDGLGEPVLVYEPVRPIADAFLSPDQRWVILRASGLSPTDRDILAVSVDSDSVPRGLIASEDALESAPTLSPDGRWIAYYTDETGRFEVVVRPFPEVEAGQWQISEAGGHGPRWSRDGREIFYRTLDGWLMAVRVETAPSFRTVGQDTLFRLGPEYTGQPEVAPDGRFLFLRRIETSPTLVLMQGFRELLQQVAPTG